MSNKTETPVDLTEPEKTILTHILKSRQGLKLRTLVERKEVLNIDEQEIARILRTLRFEYGLLFRNPDTYRYTINYKKYNEWLDNQPIEQTK